MEGGTDVCEELATSADEEEPAAEQVSCGPHAPGIDIGRGEGAGAQEHSDLVGVDLVVLGLTPMDGLHVEGVSQDEFDVLLGTEVGEPVPAEDALDSDDEVVAVGLNGVEEEVRLAAQVAVQENLAGMQRYMVRAWRSIPQ